MSKGDMDEDGHVYLIRAMGTDRYKIGWAKTPATRRRYLQIGCPVDLKLIASVPGTRRLERALQISHGVHRVRGEWFVFAPLVVDLVIEKMRKTPVPDPSNTRVTLREIADRVRAEARAHKDPLANPPGAGYAETDG